MFQLFSVRWLVTSLGVFQLFSVRWLVTSVGCVSAFQCPLAGDLVGCVSAVQCPLAGDLGGQSGGGPPLHERLHVLAQLAAARPDRAVSTQVPDGAVSRQHCDVSPAGDVTDRIPYRA